MGKKLSCMRKKKKKGQDDDNDDPPYEPAGVPELDAVESPSIKHMLIVSENSDGIVQRGFGDRPKGPKGKKGLRNTFDPPQRSTRPNVSPGDTEKLLGDSVPSPKGKKASKKISSPPPITSNGDVGRWTGEISSLPSSKNSSRNSKEEDVVPDKKKDTNSKPEKYKGPVLDRQIVESSLLDDIIKKEEDNKRRGSKDVPKSPTKKSKSPSSTAKKTTSSLPHGDDKDNQDEKITGSVSSPGTQSSKPLDLKKKSDKSNSVPSNDLKKSKDTISQEKVERKEKVPDEGADLSSRQKEYTKSTPGRYGSKDSPQSIKESEKKSNKEDKSVVEDGTEVGKPSQQRDSVAEVMADLDSIDVSLAQEKQKESKAPTKDSPAQKEDVPAVKTSMPQKAADSIEPKARTEVAESKASLTPVSDEKVAKKTESQDSAVAVDSYKFVTPKQKLPEAGAGNSKLDPTAPMLFPEPKDIGKLSPIKEEIGDKSLEPEENGTGKSNGYRATTKEQPYVTGVPETMDIESNVSLDHVSKLNGYTAGKAQDIKHSSLSEDHPEECKAPHKIGTSRYSKDGTSDFAAKDINVAFLLDGDKKKSQKVTSAETMSNGIDSDSGYEPHQLIKENGPVFPDKFNEGIPDGMTNNHDQLHRERSLSNSSNPTSPTRAWESTVGNVITKLEDEDLKKAELYQNFRDHNLAKQIEEEITKDARREALAEHKPHIDKLNKTGPLLAELSPGEGAEAVNAKLRSDSERYTAVKEAVQRRSIWLDDALSQATQFHEKMDHTLEKLEKVADKLRMPTPISAETDKIKEQISENEALRSELEKHLPAIETLRGKGDDLIGKSAGVDKDPSAKAIQDKLDQMNFLWEDIVSRSEERDQAMLETHDTAERFWEELGNVLNVLKETQDSIKELEEPAIQPDIVREQQEVLQAIKEEMESTQDDIETVRQLGEDLTSLCGEPDKPVVSKNVEDLNATWDTLNASWEEREEVLEEAMRVALQYQDALQALLVWLGTAEARLATFPPIGADPSTIKKQIDNLKEFKTEVDPRQVAVEAMNNQGEQLMKKVSSDEARLSIQEPLHDMNKRWEGLQRSIVDRQHKLEAALLKMGQFTAAIDELLTWLKHTEASLDEEKPVAGDTKLIEIELAKHKVLQNDILAHQSSVDSVHQAGKRIIQAENKAEAKAIQDKLAALDKRWSDVLQKAADKQTNLEALLNESQGFHVVLEELLHWVGETETKLSTTKPTGGLPETAKEQVDRHMELQQQIDDKAEEIDAALFEGQELVAKCDKTAASNVEHGLNKLATQWEGLLAHAAERKSKLEDALKQAQDFHDSLQSFISWLTNAEKTLNNLKPASMVMETLSQQIDDHKAFEKNIADHRETMLQLDKMGTHLKYFSQKQDVILIKNLLISVQGRWERILSRYGERSRHLEDALKRARQFNDSWKKLMDWLDEAENHLDSEAPIGNDPDKIKAQLLKFKEFQRALAAKQPLYDSTMKTGRSLKDKGTPQDGQKLDEKLTELRDKWDLICAKSVDRQHTLEEALLFSGQFADALQALLDWLYKTEPNLAEDLPVHGDIDTVLTLIGNHKVFQRELASRTSSVQTVRKQAREILNSSTEDTSELRRQLEDLNIKWENASRLSVVKQQRLDQAMKQAEEFHTSVHCLLEWLAEAEHVLRFQSQIPVDDEDMLMESLTQQEKFEKEMADQQRKLQEAMDMGEAILKICHPDAITTVKHWLTIIMARWEEVTSWASQHRARLEDALKVLKANEELLDRLTAWVEGAEHTLQTLDDEPLPDNMEDVQKLMEEHQMFQNEMSTKQPEYDRITKGHKRRISTVDHSPGGFLDRDGRPPSRRGGRGRGSKTTSPAPEPNRNPRIAHLQGKWQQVWLMALDRQRKLQDAYDRLAELQAFKNFSFDDWRRRYMRWMNNKKSRVMDMFRRLDKDHDGKLSRQEFIEGILKSKFPTNKLEMNAVADIFDRNKDGFIDYREFIAALRPERESSKPLTDHEKIQDEVKRQVSQCTCPKRYQVQQIGEGKYRFGDTQRLRLVRILRSTVMVRVGGGWMALDEFLVKNDPCRAKGRTNVELRERFILADGVSQSMATFLPRRPMSANTSPTHSSGSSASTGPIPRKRGTDTIDSTRPKEPASRLPLPKTWNGHHRLDETQGAC
uniref:EF-hand domain-containing protein n=1 Tax=Branchiostoma floridae TaxID=7739 RepID=C3YBC3_BRAFL|eukprot:XP_002606270.1 hypothetical protein BRAFLDRAFT_123699 [Branchiostoma floridae]